MSGLYERDLKNNNNQVPQSTEWKRDANSDVEEHIWVTELQINVSKKFHK